MELPIPDIGPEAAAAWVNRHLGGLFLPPGEPSPAFRGGQQEADTALAGYAVRGYAARRNEVWPPARRGASRLSPYIRHGLLSLPRVWSHVGSGPAADRGKYRDELLWQEYARHLYARLGARLGRGLRAHQPERRVGPDDAWPRAMRCMELVVGELERDGWLVNQTRMWLASQWSVRHGAAWREGEDLFFRHLLDGSRAANRLGWQWTVGTATSRPYAFKRWQVEKRAPGLCDECALRTRCPIERAPKTRELATVAPPESLRRDPDPEHTAGPATPLRRAEPRAVWLTAESLGDADPALAAHPSLPAVFVFDAPLLTRLQLSGKRLVFLAETLAELATRRPVEIHRGDPARILPGRSLAGTFAPVPGWRRLAARFELAEIHPWPWLSRPHAGPVQSFSAWVRRVRRPEGEAAGRAGEI